jgi:hypothetical protein
LGGFKIINKWSIKEFESVLINNGFVINKSLKIDGRFPLAYIVATNN